MPTGIRETHILEPADLLEPVVREIGILVHDWNVMQNSIMELFCSVLGTSRKRARSMWHAVPVDRFQRAMLKSLAEYIYSVEQLDAPATDDEKSRYLGPDEKERLLKDIVWIVESADKLGAGRDTAVHSPLAFAVEEVKFVPLALHGHPHAMKLKGKDLIPLFRLYQNRARALGIHAGSLRHYLELRKRGTDPTQLTFPQRPPWPSSQDQKKDAAGSHTTPAISLSPQPRSSQE